MSKKAVSQDTTGMKGKTRFTKSSRPFVALSMSTFWLFLAALLTVSLLAIDPARADNTHHATCSPACEQSFVRGCMMEKVEPRYDACRSRLDAGNLTNCIEPGCADTPWMNYASIAPPGFATQCSQECEASFIRVCLNVTAESASSYLGYDECRRRINTELVTPAAQLATDNALKGCFAGCNDTVAMRISKRLACSAEVTNANDDVFHQDACMVVERATISTVTKMEWSYVFNRAWCWDPTAKHDGSGVECCAPCGPTDTFSGRKACPAKYSLGLWSPGDPVTGTLNHRYQSPTFDRGCIHKTPLPNATRQFDSLNTLSIANLQRVCHTEADKVPGYRMFQIRLAGDHQGNKCWVCDRSALDEDLGPDDGSVVFHIDKQLTGNEAYGIGKTTYDELLRASHYVMGARKLLQTDVLREELALNLVKTIDGSAFLQQEDASNLAMQSYYVEYVAAVQSKSAQYTCGTNSVSSDWRLQPAYDLAGNAIVAFAEDLKRLAQTAMDATVILFPNRAKLLSPDSGLCTGSHCSDFYRCDAWMATNLCPRGKYRPPYSNADTVPACASCPAGRFGIATGLVGIEQCSECPAGHYSESAGRTELSSCIRCYKGKAGEDGNTAQSSEAASCRDCDAGRYQDQQGEITCKACPAGQFQPVFANDYVESLISVRAGAHGGSCTCPDGQVYWVGDEGNDCRSLACFNGGTPGECHLYAGNWSYNSVTCATGEATAPEPRFGCKSCAAGKHSVDDAMRCTSCATGQFQAQPGQESCPQCGVGRYQDELGATRCKDCPAGYMNAGTGRDSSCSKCPDGHYSNQPAASTCQACVPGKFARNNATSCEPTPPGQYQDSPGQSSSKKCEPPGYQDLPGQTTCKRCKPGDTPTLDRTTCVIDVRWVIPFLAVLVFLCGFLAWRIYRRAKHSQKYTVVKFGKRRCCARRSRLDFPRQSRFSRSNIEEGAKLGNGAFGEVNQGTLQVGKASVRIAVKHVLAAKATDAQRKDTIVECRLQCELESPFVVKCFGFATGPGPDDFSILLELMDLGDLPSYVKSLTQDGARQLSKAERLQWMIEVASALEYMHASGLIHADVAARNLCLCHYQGRVVCKLTDFGLTRRVDKDTGCYWLPEGQPVPMLWAAPEVLPVSANFQDIVGKSGQRSRALLLTPTADVWSFGVTMWEVEALAATGTVQRPYGGKYKLAEIATFRTLLKRKKAALDFNFGRSIRGNVNSGNTLSKTIRDVAKIQCLRVRRSCRATMVAVRQSLQECDLCDAQHWNQEQINNWLLDLGAPMVEDSDLFALSTFEDLSTELLDDNYRADYLDPNVHPDFTPALSKLIASELKGFQGLIKFMESDEWPKDSTSQEQSQAQARSERFGWMNRVQTQKSEGAPSIEPRVQRLQRRNTTSGFGVYHDGSVGNTSTRSLPSDRPQRDSFMVSPAPPPELQSGLSVELHTISEYKTTDDESKKHGRGDNDDNVLHETVNPMLTRT